MFLKRKDYWNLCDYKRQRDFICSTVTENKPARIRTNAKRARKCSRTFIFKTDDNNVRVCKSFYLKTLDIGEKNIEFALKQNKSGTFASRDKRGCHTPKNKTPSGTHEHAKEHIESFPIMDPHYTRKDTRRKFLGSDLNISKMYRLYKLECVKLGRKPAGAAKYRTIFCQEYNYSFHTPKKDQCRICNLYAQKEVDGSLSDEFKQQYQDHINRKIRAREEKQFDKDFAKKNPKYHTVTFDLQSVLQIPCSNVSQVYYKRKLNCYNLSVYSLADTKATCFMWNETEGNRGANEIATSILLYIKSLPQTEHIVLFSDSCSGQNRNRHMVAALLHSVISNSNIKSINQKYLEPGHTEMECDSMHAAIEAAKKCTSVYVPSEWDSIVRLARKKKPYTVVPLKYYDILNFKEVSSKIFPTTIVDTTGKRVQWLKLKWIQLRKHEPDCVFFKYEFDEDTFHCIKINMNAKKSTRATVKSGSVFKLGVTEPNKCYTSKLPISDAKKRDLLSLCKDGTIPEDFYLYFKSLPCSSETNDRIPEPDMLEEKEESDED